MKPLIYTYRQKKRASTLMALACSEFEAGECLLQKLLYREAVVHMYFTCFYAGQALLCDRLSVNPSHKNIQVQLHSKFGRNPTFPRQYLELHKFLHSLRNEFNYKTTHTPNPHMLRQKQRILQRYLKFALKVVPRVDVAEILKGFYDLNKGKVKDFSYDIYCPKTYAHHTRLTFWQPPFYLGIYSPGHLILHAKKFLSALKVRRTGDYVVGINSRFNQYQNIHVLMLDIDSVDAAVESALKPLGGILLKSGRGFHFIGTN
jgi:uncharacterized protein (UPF0332 family)